MRIFVAPVLVLGLAFPLAAGLADDQQPAPTSSQQTAGTPDTNAADNAASGEKRICRLMYHEGTLIRTQTCHTQHEWDAIRTYNQRQVDEAQQRGMLSSPR